MKDGSTHFAYKAEQVVDLDAGAIVAITTQGGAVGDTTSIQGTLPAGLPVAEQIATSTAQGQYPVHRGAVRSGDGQGISQRGEFGGDARDGCGATYRFPNNHGASGRTRPAEQAAVYANKRRIEGCGATAPAAAGRVSGAALRASV